MNEDRSDAHPVTELHPSSRLVAFLKTWEGPPHYWPREDPCVPGVFDIGYGHVCHRNHKAITPEEAELLLIKDIEEVAEGVRREVCIPLRQCEFDALISFAFNVGLDEDADAIPEGLGDSTLLKYVEFGNFALAAGQFDKWNRAGGVVVKGLVKRRAAERAMFTDGDYSGRP